MPDDGLQWIEGVLGAVGGIGGGEPDGGDIVGARCPKCNAADFVKVSDLWTESVGRLEESGGVPGPALIGGMTDLQIVQKFPPPRRGSAAAVAIGVAVPLGAISYFLYRRFGETVGEISVVVALVATSITLMTMLRKYSDKDYHARRKRNRLYLCKQCGQVVAA